MRVLCRECLLLQLKRKDEQLHPEVFLARDIIEHHMEDFSKKHYEKLTRQLKVSEDELRRSHTPHYQSLIPSPGETGVDAKTQYIIPPILLL